ncbi:MAG: hypothetical protein OEV31_03860 [Gammaproteobacteria bacterium]|nr:hypothetical protein [Gammaproteobacteria bacterium]
MNTPLRYSLQAVLYLGFAAFVAYFSTMPVYSPVPPGSATITLSFSHAAKPAGDCRRRTEAELAQLPPNMRAPLDCPRKRFPIRVEMDIDGTRQIKRKLGASGLSHDRAASFYQKITVPPGPHRLAVRLRDTARAEGFDYEREADVDLRPGQQFVIDFHADNGGFEFR